VYAQHTGNYAPLPRHMDEAMQLHRGGPHKALLQAVCARHDIPSTIYAEYIEWLRNGGKSKKISKACNGISKHKSALDLKVAHLFGYSVLVSVASNDPKHP